MKNRTHTTRRQLGLLAITRIVREHHPIESSSTGGSVGQYIDEYLAREAAQGHSIQTVELHFEPEQWAEIAESIYAGYVEEAR